MSAKKTDVEKRQKAIQELLKKEVIEDQETLVDLLQSEYGIVTTQAVISRDFKKLGTVKKTLGDKRVYANPDRDIKAEILQLGVIDIQHNESMIVINTLPGLAPFVGDTIDASDIEVLGCLAGENVVFVSPKSEQDIDKTVKTLKELLNSKQLKT